MSLEEILARIHEKLYGKEHFGSNNGCQTKSTSAVSMLIHGSGSDQWEELSLGTNAGVKMNSDGSLSKMMQRWKEYQLQCLKYLYEAPPVVAEGKFCNRTFDNYACWPDGLPGTFVNVSCPWYLPWASTVLQRQAYRFCTSEGTWLLKENSTLPWRNLSECEAADRDAPEEQLLYLSVIYTTGYALSFSALVIATAILLGFRHLHCTRNYIHLNLFTSFILRAVSVFIKDSVLKWMYKTATQEHQWEGLISYQESLSCRLVFVMMQYFVAANYYWLLVEGMYLYTLLVLSVFSEQRIFRLFLCIGWGVPMLFVILWGTVKYLYEDEGCWSRNYNMNYWLIIRLPILIAIAVNFLIFIRVICIIISKLQANLMCKTDTKCRLAKSTLTLIPLLGTHEVIFAFVTDEHARGMLRFVKLFTELSFASFQGLMVAILYCFINNEVQMEFRKSWERWRLEHFYVQRDSSMKPLKCPGNSISSGGTVGSSVYTATCQATFS
ncbi:PREDICTED: glucagon-like peptide 1 receptor [Gavialis gangeticus]|uniref:glucagon-like peptide 1 receptor n=1 Tax=Gavialis gangeticus TaxID=94835 RepID=UPI00092E28B9|nr:PREDICTED: glucagon-like peptide 1 receptor [Gavialis gangeticus]